MKKAPSDISLEDWLLRGSYPEIRANPKVDRQIWCSSYIQTYLARDVRQVLNVGDLNVFNRFLRLCAGRTGQILNISGIEVDLIVDRNARLYPIEVKASSTLLPPHAESLKKWRTLAGTSAEKGIIVAPISQRFSLKECNAVPWNEMLE